EVDTSATLYADFRYAEKARAVEGVTFVETARDLHVSLAELLSGRRIAFEEAHLAYAGYRVLADGGAELVPSAGVVEGLRAVKDDLEVDAMRRAGALSDEIFGALVEERLVGRTERD